MPRRGHDTLPCLMLAGTSCTGPYGIGTGRRSGLERLKIHNSLLFGQQRHRETGKNVLTQDVSIRTYCRHFWIVAVSMSRGPLLKTFRELKAIPSLNLRNLCFALLVVSETCESEASPLVLE